MTELDVLAGEVGASGRTLRRAAQRGTIRCSRRSERRVVIPPPEREYVRRRWPLFAALLETLRTLPNVRLAVLFGSIARGEESTESDLDLFVRLEDDDFRERASLRERVEAIAGRRVQVVGLKEAERAPLLFADVLRDGRVLVDRDGDWRMLKRRERRIQGQAREADRQLDEAAWAVLEHLVADS
jgi:predicted nucleotidyltransferase